MKNPPTNPEAPDFNDTVGGMLKLLGRLLGENINLAWSPGPNLWNVKLDPAQIDQILANLCVNARDAIAGIGRLAIETCNITVDEAYCEGRADAVPGEYVLLTVSDTGHGMSKEVLDHIFEPFFTTKEVGKGTGLGLATVFGIVAQNKGFITVYSEPGKGTTFKIHLPRCAAQVSAAPVAGPSTTVPSGSETLLLVEDEESVRVTTQKVLKKLGYTVLVAESPGEALHLAAKHVGEIHLLITDLILPGMSGRDLALQMCALRPEIKRLFISGYAADVIADDRVWEDGMPFLAKPFSRDVLARKVRDVLDGK
jgi:CheY-like chemotaxis protein